MLPGIGWASRLLDTEEVGPFETMLRLIRTQALARCADDSGSAIGDLECDLYPLAPDLPEAAETLQRALHRIAEPLTNLIQHLRDLLETEADSLDAAQRQRIESAIRSVQRRAQLRLVSWEAMLQTMRDPAPEPGTRPQYVHTLELERRGGADRDAGLHRHWLDPSIPFAAALAAPAHGLLITSATLRDTGAEDAEASWAEAEARVGAAHLPSPALRVSVASPFDYAAQTRAFVVTDVGAEMEALAGAYRALFTASGGGGLGLFTAISRLKAVHSRIAEPLEAAGISLLAQHVDAMGQCHPRGRLPRRDGFLPARHRCDARRCRRARPGAAPGRVRAGALAAPRHPAPRAAASISPADGRRITMTARLASACARPFGRLVRTETDRGVFVLLDRRTPGRLLSAFPPGVEVRRVGLADAVAETPRLP